MTYSIDIINLFINKYINNIKLKDISKSLNISLQTLKRWFYKYSNNIVNKKTILNKDLYENKKIHGLNKKKIYKINILSFVYKNEGCTLDNIYNYIDNIWKYFPLH